MIVFRAYFSHVKQIVASIFFLLIFFTSCISFDETKLENLKGEVRVIGHAGSGFYSWVPFNPYPSNSISSIRNAMDADAEGIEVDVHMTSDKEFILYHDKLLDTKTDAIGCPSDFTLKDLEKVQYKLGLPFDWIQSEKIISLESLVQELKSRGSQLELHLDLRNHSECHDHSWDLMWEGILLRQLHQKIEKWEYPAKKVYFISYSKDLLLDAIEMQLPYHLSFEIVGETEEGINWAKQNKVNSITIKPSLLTAEISEQLHKAGIEVITFGARSKRGSRDLLNLNPDVIQSNNVKAVRSLLQKD